MRHWSFEERLRRLKILLYTGMKTEKMRDDNDMKMSYVQDWRIFTEIIIHNTRK